MWPVRGTFPKRGGKDLPSEDPRLVNEVMDLLTAQEKNPLHLQTSYPKVFFNLCLPLELPPPSAHLSPVHLVAWFE